MKVKQHLSVLMLATKSTIYWVLGLVVFMAAVQGMLFHLALGKISPDLPQRLEEVVNTSRIVAVSGFCFVGLCTVLSLTGSEFGGSKVGYTLKRLSVRERTTALWWAGYNALCFSFFWASQTVIAFFLCRTYVGRMDPSLVTDQTVFLAFYRNNFLHSLLPLAETSRFLRNTVFALCLGICASSFSWRQRRGKFGMAVFALAHFVLVTFSKPLGSLESDIFTSIVALVLAAPSLGALSRKEPSA